ncbi:MAG: tetratricopeptide repeat protein [bacterium]|nr:tetratricopeptide repeat protein [bacterium]
MTRPMQLLIHVLFLFSGATALAYQVTWVRNLMLVFGASHQATSVVLASFMAGLCVGGFWFGRTSEQMRRPLRTYAYIEIAIAMYALVLPSLLGWIDGSYVTAARAVDGVTPTLNLLRLAMASLVLLPPTILMGATLPVLVSALVRHRGDFGARLSWLYGINTLGAVVGAVVTGFVLIPAVGLWRTQVTAMIINVAIGALALVADRRIGTAATDESDRGFAETDTPPPDTPELDRAARAAAHVAYRGAAVCGMCALALEVMWTRAVSLSVGTTTYSFTVMLASFLTGIWLGSWLHAALPPRRVSAARQLGFVMVTIGLASLAVSFWIPRLPELVVKLNVALYGVVPRIHNLTTLVSGFAVMLVPCIFMGISFPLAGEARLGLGQAFGRSAGDTIGWNTFGSIVGSLLAGFVLIPELGLQRSMVLAASIYVAYGCVILGIPLLVTPGRRRWVAAAALVAAALAVSLAGPGLPTWDVRSLGGFQSNQLTHYVDSEGNTRVRDQLDEAVVLYYEEGRAATVSVIDRKGALALLVNGKVVASDGLGDLPNQLMLGHAPLLSHPDPKKALVVGLGTGFTLASLTAHQSLEQITLVEIEPAVIAAQPHFAPVNFDPFSDPRLRVEIQDGRNYLKTTGEHFDVVTADPIHPWNQGSGYLYTAEYYETVKDRLSERGVMCQWLPIYGLSIENYKSIVATFAAVFPETTLWQIGVDSVLVGSEAPFEFDLETLARRLAEPTIEEQLRLIGVQDVYDFMAELTLDDDDVREYANRGPINRDDNLYLEFASPLSIGTHEVKATRSVINQYRDKPLRESLFASLSANEREALDRARAARRATLDTFFSKATPVKKLGQLRKILAEAPGSGSASNLLGQILVEQGSRQGRSGRPRAAERSLREAVELVPEYADAWLALGTLSLRNGNYSESIEQLERSLALRPHRWINLARLSKAQLGAERRTDAIRSLRAAVALNPHSAALNDQLAHLEADETIVRNRR